MLYDGKMRRMILGITEAVVAATKSLDHARFRMVSSTPEQLKDARHSGKSGGQAGLDSMVNE